MSEEKNLVEFSKSMIIRKVPEKLRRKFKALCATEGISQQDKIIELMESAVKK